MTLPRTIEKYISLIIPHTGHNQWAGLTKTRRLHANTLKQWDILEQRLSQPGQQYIALPDRPTLADISYFPYAMPWMFTFLGVCIQDWPHIEKWAGRMMSRPAVRQVMETAPKIGH